MFLYKYRYEAISSTREMARLEKGSWGVMKVLWLTGLRD